MDNKCYWCYWGTKNTESHITQCLTTCHNPKIRATVTDECCMVCPYKEMYEVVHDDNRPR